MLEIYSKIKVEKSDLRVGNFNFKVRILKKK